MRNFQDTFETSKQSYISAFSICMTVPLINDIQPGLIHQTALTISIRYKSSSSILILTEITSH